MTYEKSLLECKWKDISFPIANLKTDLKHDLVEHKYPDRDGAHVESTGRAPLHVSCKALFYNNISRGLGETWKFGILFPTTYAEFLEVCKDRSVGQLQHPFIGTFDAKLVSMETELEADRRDGVIVNLEWIETIKIETFDEDSTTIATTVISDAQDVEDAFATLPDVADAAALKKEKKISFLDAIDSIKALVDTTLLIGQKLLAQIDKVLYHINNLMFSISRINSVLFSDLKGKLEALKASAKALRNLASSKLGEIRFYIAPKDTTISAVASRLNNNVVDIMKLNPAIAAHPIVKALTPIKYYKL